MTLKYFIIIAHLIFSFQGCSTLEGLLGGAPKPTFDFKKVDITNINLTELTLQMLTEVKNPYPVSLPKSNLLMDVSIEGMKLTNVSTDLGKIEAKATKLLPFEFKVKYSDLLQLYKNFPTKELLDVKLDGKLAIPIPQSVQSLAGKETMDFPFTQTKQIPAVLPDIEIRNFQIIKPEPQQILSQVNSADVQQAATSFLDKLLSGKKTNPGSAVQAGLANVDINVDTVFDMALTNKAASKLNFNNLDYTLMLSGEKFLTGKPVDIINSGNESIIKIKSSFPLKSVTTSIADAIQKKTANFNLNGSSGLEVPGISQDSPLKFQYDKNGTFTWK